MIDSTVFVKMIKKAFWIMRKVSMIGRRGLSFLIAAEITLDLVSICLFVKTIQNHSGVSLSLAHKFKFKLVIKYANSI